MENTYYVMSVLMTLLFIRSTAEAPLGATEKLKTNYTFKENQEVAPTWEERVLLKTTNISSQFGQGVTLLVDTIKESEIQDIQWVKNGINFATTKPHKNVTIRDHRYNGRLRGSPNGSLIIYGLTMEDQGEYKADILMLNLKNHQIIFFLHINEERDSDRGHTAVVLSVVVVLVLVVVGALVAYLMLKQKKFFRNAREFPVTKRRREPEGNSEQEKLKCPQKESRTSPQNRDDKTNYDEESDHDEYQDAVESQEEETKGGHIP